MMPLIFGQRLMPAGAGEWSIFEAAREQGVKDQQARERVADKLASGEVESVGARRGRNGKVSEHFRFTQKALAPRPLAQPAKSVHDARVPKRVRGKAK